MKASKKEVATQTANSLLISVCMCGCFFFPKEGHGSISNIYISINCISNVAFAFIVLLLSGFLGLRCRILCVSRLFSELVFYLCFAASGHYVT